MALDHQGADHPADRPPGARGRPQARRQTSGARLRNCRVLPAAPSPKAAVEVAERHDHDGRGRHRQRPRFPSHRPRPRRPVPVRPRLRARRSRPPPAPAPPTSWRSSPASVSPFQVFSASSSESPGPRSAPSTPWTRPTATHGHHGVLKVNEQPMLVRSVGFCLLTDGWGPGGRRAVKVSSIGCNQLAGDGGMPLHTEFETFSTG